MFKTLSYLTQTIVRKGGIIVVVKFIAGTAIPYVVNYGALLLGHDFEMPNWFWGLLAVIFGLLVLTYEIADHARKIEEPKLDFVYEDNPFFGDKWYSRIGVKNISSIPIDDVEVTLLNV